MTETPLTFEQIYRNLDGLAAMATAQCEGTRKRKGEYDTEFIKRIVARYVHNMQGFDIVRAAPQQRAAREEGK